MATTGAIFFLSTLISLRYYKTATLKYLISNDTAYHDKSKLRRKWWHALL